MGNGQTNGEAESGDGKDIVKACGCHHYTGYSVFVGVSQEEFRMACECTCTCAFMCSGGGAAEELTEINVWSQQSDLLY